MNITSDFKDLVKKIVGETEFHDKIEDYFIVFNKRILGIRFTGRMTREVPEVAILYEGGAIFELSECNIHILIDNECDDVRVFLFTYASATADKKVIITGSRSSILTMLSKMGYVTPSIAPFGDKK